MKKSKRGGGLESCRAGRSMVGQDATALSKDRWTRGSRPVKLRAQRPGGKDTDSPGSEFLCPLTLRAVSASSPQGPMSPPVRSTHKPPALPTSSRGRCALQGEQPWEGFAHWKALSRCESDYYNPPCPRWHGCPLLRLPGGPSQQSSGTRRAPWTPGCLWGLQPELSMGQLAAHRVFLQVQGPK